MHIRMGEGKNRVKKSQVFPGVGMPPAISVLVIVKVRLLSLICKSRILVIVGKKISLNCMNSIARQSGMLKPMLIPLGF